MKGWVRQLFRWQIWLYVFLRVGKIKVTAKQGLKILRIFVLIMTNGIRKVMQGVDIFDKRILDSCKFISDRIRPHLQQSFPLSRQNINQYLSAWCITYQDSIFYISVFLVSDKREGEEKYREPPPSLHFYFLFSK